MNLTCELTVELSVKNFRVRDLANLKTGALIDSHWALGRHVPVFANGLLLAWGQFEAVGRTLAVRLADLA